jgi:hypothetical protein
LFCFSEREYIVKNGTERKKNKIKAMIATGKGGKNQTDKKNFSQ